MTIIVNPYNNGVLTPYIVKPMLEWSSHCEEECVCKACRKMAEERQLPARLSCVVAPCLWGLLPHYEI